MLTTFPWPRFFYVTFTPYISTVETYVWLYYYYYFMPTPVQKKVLPLGTVGQIHKMSERSEAELRLLKMDIEFIKDSITGLIEACEGALHTATEALGLADQSKESTAEFLDKLKQSAKDVFKNRLAKSKWYRENSPSDAVQAVIHEAVTISARLFERKLPIWLKKLYRKAQPKSLLADEYQVLPETD